MNVGKATSGPPPTEKQTDYVRALQRRLRLPDRMLDDHCVKKHRKPFARLDRSEVSALIDELIAWESLPADMQRSMGQLDLP